MARRDTGSALTSDNKIVAGPKVAESINPVAQLFLCDNVKGTIATPKDHPVAGIRVEKLEDISTKKS